MLYPPAGRSHPVCTLALALAAAIPALLYTEFVAPARAAVFGADTRTPLPAALRPLSTKIGTLVARKDGATCTAFCVADDAIATASHCLFGTAASARDDLTDLTFSVGERDARATSALAAPNSKVGSDVLAAGTESLAVSPPIDAGNDWAVARLAAPVCRDGGLKLSEKSREDIEDLARAGHVFEVAVHRDIPERGLMLSRDCQLSREFPAADAATIARDFAEPEAVIFHSCDTGGGSSGSPLLVQGDEGPEVVAMNVGTYILSHMVTRAGGVREAGRSEAIANTAVEISRLIEGRAALNRARLVRASMPQASSLLRASAPYKPRLPAPNWRAAP